MKVYKKCPETPGTADSKSVQKWTRVRTLCSSPSQRERPAAPCLLSFSSLEVLRTQCTLMPRKFRRLVISVLRLATHCAQICHYRFHICTCQGSMWFCDLSDKWWRHSFLSSSGKVSRGDTPWLPMKLYQCSYISENPFIVELSVQSLLDFFSLFIWIISRRIQ